MTDRPTPSMTVYGAPWCPDCKRAKQFLGEQRVPYDWVDIDLDEEGRAYVQRVNDGKQIIPTIVFEDGSILVEPTNSELALKLDIGLSASRTHYDLIVVGGGPAGLTAALYAAREGIDTLIVEQSAVGGQAGVTERIENYPGFPDGIQGARLADQMRLQAERFGVEILQAQSVAGVRATDNFKVVSTEAGDEYSAGALIVATGSRYRRLDVPGEDDLIGAGIHFCATCDGPLLQGRRGGGHRRRQQRGGGGPVSDQVRLQGDPARQRRGPAGEPHSPGTGREQSPSWKSGPIRRYGSSAGARRSNRWSSPTHRAARPRSFTRPACSCSSASTPTPISSAAISIPTVGDSSSPT